MSTLTHTAALDFGLPTVPAQTSQAAIRNIANVVLFLAAPFIGLVYAMALPFVGLAMMAIIGGKALIKVPAARMAAVHAKNVALLIAAPFIGLAYAVALPFIGIALIAKIGYQAYRAG